MSMTSFIPATLSKRPTLLLALHPRSRLARSFLHTPSSQPLTLAIVGGGLSGLSSAYYFIQTLTPALRKACKVVVFEKQGRTGGWCRSLDVPLQEGEKGNMVFETGPRSIRPAGLQGWLTLEMAHTIGLTPSILTVPKTSPSAKNRFILSPIPSDPAKSPLLLLPSSIFGALRAGLTLPLLRRALPSLLLEPFRRRSPLHDFPDGGDESVDSFFSRRFGRRLAEDLVSAGIHGVYSGDTRRLSIRAVFPGLWQAERERGSVILSAILGQKKGQAVSAYRANGVVENAEYEKIKQRMRGKDPKLVERLEGASVWGVEGGLEKMTDCLRDWLRAEGVEIRLGDEGSVSAVEKVDGYWSVTTPTGTLEATHLITTLPSLLPSPLAPPPIPSSTVSVINLAFPSPPPSSSPLFPSGFGYLIPRTVPPSRNPHQVLGVIFDSDVMPSVDAAPESLVKVSMLLGGSYWLDGAPDPLPDHSTLVERAMETLRIHFPTQIFPSPAHSMSHTHPECIPQVPVNYFRDLRAFAKRLRESGNVAVAGGGTGAVGVNGAVRGAWEVGVSFAESVNEGKGGQVKTGVEMWEL